MFIISRNGQHIGPFKTFTGAKKWARANMSDVEEHNYGTIIDPSYYATMNGVSTQTGSTSTSPNSAATETSPRSSRNSKES